MLPSKSVMVYSSDIPSEISNLDELTISSKKSTSSHAAKIFQNIHAEKEYDRQLVNYGTDQSLTVPEIKDERAQRWVYELAFSTLKYQELLEEILVNSCFYPSQSISTDLTGLVMVMLYDFQNRKFQPRSVCEADDVIADVRDIEQHLHKFKTKIAAALARCRIKNDAISIDLILPEAVRNQEKRASTLPLYAWVNALKISLEDVMNILELEGFPKVKSVSEFQGQSFCQDRHCQDLLLFPSQIKCMLYDLQLFTSYKLVIQDKTRSLAPHSVKALMNMDDDIVVTNACSRLTVAHMSVLTDQNSSKVYVCGVKAELQQTELRRLFEEMGCKNVKLIPQNFTDIEPTDPRLQKVKVILLVPQCSASGVSNPVDFILNEHGDTGLLQDLSQGTVSEEKLNVLVKRQAEELMHAIKFPKVQAIVYSTCSVYPEENEQIVNPVLGKRIEGSKLQPYRLSAPVIPLCCASEITCAVDKFFKIEPSEQVNGCFIAVLTRERDSSAVVSVKDVLARAAAKGLLDGPEPNKPRKREDKRKKPKSLNQKKGSFSGTQSRITDFINEQKTVVANENTAMVKSYSGEQTTELNLDAQSAQRISVPALPSRPKKSITSMTSVNRLSERKAKRENKLVLKPVEMLLPPVTIRYLGPTGSHTRSFGQTFFYQYNGLISQPPFPYSRNSFITSLGVKRQRDVGSASRRQPRPWL
uniref:NOP2/Sun RNA methyltransferase family member 7 n=1 Tax=Callorhinchus milii TaxID=7868 RepID=A0A4W3IBV7_CALMI